MSLCAIHDKIALLVYKGLYKEAKSRIQDAKRLNVFTYTKLRYSCDDYQQKILSVAKAISLNLPPYNKL